MASFFFKKINEMTSIKEASIILLCGYSSYLISELLHLSGIISLFCCGLMMSVYSYPNLSEKSQQGTHLAFDTVGYLAEAFVFAYLGITTLEIPFSKIPIVFSLLMIAVIMFARFLTVFLLPCIMFLMKRNYNLKMKELQVVWYSGLIRGAIAFALSFEVTSKNAIDIRGCVLFIVLLTTCVGSIFLESFSEYINLK